MRGATLNPAFHPLAFHWRQAHEHRRRPRLHGHRVAHGLPRERAPRLGFLRPQAGAVPPYRPARRLRHPAALGRIETAGSFVFTSNVDGHFQRAGFSPQRIDECHGSIHRLQCLGPCSPALWPATGLEPALDEVRCALLGPLPACPYCGGIARPNVLMFDDWAWNDTLREQQAQRCRSWLDGVRRPLVIEIGAGMDIPTVRHFSQRVVLQHGGSLLRINPREAQIGELPGVALAGGALACLAAIDAALAGGAR